jgi:hypothetical protein
MASTTHSKALLFFPSLTDVAFLAPVFVLVALFKGEGHMIEGDTGWHIRTGEWILANGRVPTHDIFSFSKPGEPWFAWEWLWDVGAALLHAQWGMPAVMLASLFFICLSLGILYRLCLRQSKSVLAAFISCWLAISISTLHWIARPHVFTFLFFIVFLWVLQIASEGRWKALFVLPLLTVLWTNLHGGFLSGFVLIGGFLVGELLGAILALRSETRALHTGRASRYAAALAGCVVASLANPYGYRLHAHAFGVLTSTGAFFKKLIQEWLGFNFNSFHAPFFEILLFLGVTATLWSAYRGKYAYACLIPAWLHFALTSARNAPLCAFLVAPIIAEMLTDAWKALHEREIPSWARRIREALNDIESELAAFEFIPRAYLVSGVAFLLVVLASFSAGAPPNLRAIYSDKKYPKRAVQALRTQLLTNRVFAPDEWGDFLIYELYPSGRVYIDGRFDYYGQRFSERYVETMDAKHGWADEFDRRQINAVLIPATSALSSTLKESRRWSVTYDDGVAIFFLKRTPPPSATVSLARMGEGLGSFGDREVTGTHTRGRRITQLTHIER